MAQAVTRRPLTAEAQIRAWFNRCVLCGGKSGTGTVIRVFRVSPVNIIPSWLSILVYHMGMEP
jgi:hypothetical protein